MCRVEMREGLNMAKTIFATWLIAIAIVVTRRGGATTVPATAPELVSPPSFAGHFVAGCDSPAVSCFELWLEQDGTALRGWHAAATANANRIDGGDYYTQGATAQLTIRGKANGVTATIRLLSTFTGKPATATITVWNDRLEWEASEDLAAIPRKATLQRQ